MVHLHGMAYVSRVNRLTYALPFNVMKNGTTVEISTFVCPITSSVKRCIFFQGLKRCIRLSLKREDIGKINYYGSVITLDKTPRLCTLYTEN